jgi:hypothetical protein
VINVDPNNSYIVIEFTGLSIGKSSTESEIPTDSHIVIDFQEPSAENGYIWYRLYKDGWVEQGGQIAVSGDNVAVTLPVEMADANYPVIGGVLDASAANGWRYANRTTTGFTKMLIGNTNCGGSWQVSGMAKG